MRREAQIHISKHHGDACHLSLSYEQTFLGMIALYDKVMLNNNAMAITKVVADVKVLFKSD